MTPSVAAVTAAAAVTRRCGCPPASQLLLDALPQLHAQFAAKAVVHQHHQQDDHNNSSDQGQHQHIFPLLSPQQYAWVQSQWSTKKNSMSPSFSPSSSIPQSLHNKTAVTQKTAAVLVPLLVYQGQPSILFTKRASNLSLHASEISFPGGHAEDCDVTLVDTAIREAMEELLPTKKATNSTDHPLHQHGQEQDQEQATWLYDSSSSSSSSAFVSSLQVLGYATTLPSKRYMPVTPVVAVCPIDIATSAELQSWFPGNPQEVEQVFCMSLQELLQVETTAHPPQSSMTRHRFGSQYKSPMFISPQYGTIWGLTAYILQPLLHDLFQPVLLPQWNQKNKKE
jgi:hypothetical protein